MARPSSKTPQQRLAELDKARETQLRRLAADAASDNPQIAQVREVRESYSKEINGYSRQLVGPQSFENRLEGFRLRLDSIEAEQALVTYQEAQAKNARTYLDEQIAKLGNLLMEGQEVTEDMVNDILDNIPMIEGDIETLTDNFYTAKHRLQEHTNAKKVPAKQAEITAEAAGD